MSDPHMSMDQAVRQVQTLSPLQQQSLAVLSLPLPELQEYILEEIRDYPLLEVRARQAESLSSIVESARREESHSGENDREREASFRSRDGEWVDPLTFLGTKISFTEDLIQQVSVLDLPKELLSRCIYIIYSLSPRGYLQDSDEELARQMGVSVYDARQAVYVVQSLSPDGVGARDLSECLVLQLAQSPYFNEYTVRIAKDHLQDLAAGRYDRIGRALGISSKEALRWCNEIRKLNPIPSEGYHAHGYTQFVVPEAFVTMEPEGVTVRMNDESMPAVVLPEEYLSLPEAGDDPDARRFLKEHQQRAALLQKQIDMRGTTLERVIVCMAQLQPEFFRSGRQALRPMTMQQVADRLNVHISTVSRAVSGKYIDTPMGVVALRSLFSAPLPAQGAAVSAAGVKERLRELIRREDKNHPLTDSQLCGALRGQHIQISRRSVANYRCELGIPPAAARRQAGESGI
ncbi:RNA polymerase factor sigma-54 [Dysosmobacter sp.]|uniref:RNA polymerase factor sigma-54 n=1 Tax=Dysosmobacter sp. TaxID=2591382 RepID=UPI002A899FD0|nr:RNA polymerase factor sigma-54 [Dysosmobacter sp.]MDY3281736.1 RNA polymerase factor sigma-54 [Dysosmobacter sp.]